jgi:CHAT domain-containing protein/predicted negative regulator of RcsB-dependent stress response
LGCRSPEKIYRSIKDETDREEFDSALAHVNTALTEYQDGSDEWIWRLRILKARILVSRNQHTETLTLLAGDLPAGLAVTDIAEQRELYRGIAHRNGQQFVEAEKNFDQAEQIVHALPPSFKYQLLIAKADLEVDEKKYVDAEANYKRALVMARQEKLPPSFEMSALGNLGRLATSQEHFDAAVDINQLALQLSRELKLQGHMATILGNLGWAYFELGDFENALEFYKQGADASQQSGLATNTAYWFSGVANSYVALREYVPAEELARTTLKRAHELRNAQAVTACLNTLTDIMLRTGRLGEAEQYNQEALKMEDKFGTLDALLFAGHIAIANKHFNDAEKLFHQVLAEPNAETLIKWQAEAGLAQVWDDQGRFVAAEQQYLKAINTIEQARRSINHDELRLSFLSSGIAVYGGYIDFLIRHGRPADALNQAELSRARTLAEGLSFNEQVESLHAALHAPPQQIAQRFHATLLFYWLGEKHSYLWAVTPSKTAYFTLPPASEIDPLIKSYRDLTLKSGDLLKSATSTGEKLYASLVEPAKNLAPPGSRVILLPDASLYGLNFETLIVPGPQPHFWIEDVTLTTASSLSLLASAANRAPPKEKNLLLVGDTVPVPEFGPLPQAPAEMEKIEQYFPKPRRAILQGPQATPSAYLASEPGRFSYLHFVTHGTASRARPLESAVILSKGSSSDTYKLYARDIVQHRLNANLVTISACNGSGTRAYSGEGLVGLSWAFLRAGAHNVIGALWEVSDASTPELMDSLYKELNQGKDPATALRDAKLTLLHSGNVFAKPFYWAPFQLYAGS